MNVVLRSIDGRFIKQEFNAQQISIQGLVPGIYLLYIMDEGNNVIKIEKLVKDM